MVVWFRSHLASIRKVHVASTRSIPGLILQAYGARRIGHWTKLSQAVLNTQKNVIAMASESQGHTLETLHHQSSSILMEELKQINFNVSRRELERLYEYFTLIKDSSVTKLDCRYPHYIGHPLGLGESQGRILMVSVADWIWFRPSRIGW